MNVAVRYYTRSGNPQKLADVVAKAVSVEAKDITSPLAEKADVLFLGCSYYAFDIDDDIKAQQHMLKAYPDRKAMYTVGDGNTEVYYLKNAVGQICSFTEAPREIKF